jgi:hypothetical protein
MKTKATTWLAQIVAVLVMLAAGTASASSGLLSGNSCQGKNSLEGGFHRGSAAVSAETCRGCGDFFHEEAADSVVAPTGRWQTVNEAMSARARAYQTQVTGRTGEAYVVNGVRFDGVSGATLLDAKGPGYATFVRNGQFQPWFQGRQSLLAQAESQVAAANGAPITWHVAEADAATAMRNLLSGNPRTATITVVHTPVVP